MTDEAESRRRLYADKHLDLTRGQSASARGYHLLPYNWRQLSRGDLAEISASQAATLAKLQQEFCIGKLPWLTAGVENADAILRWEAGFAIQLVLDTGRRLADLSGLRGYRARKPLQESRDQAGLLFNQTGSAVAVMPFLRPSDEVGDEDENDVKEREHSSDGNRSTWPKDENSLEAAVEKTTPFALDAAELTARETLPWSERRFLRSTPSSKVRLDLPLSDAAGAFLALRSDLPGEGTRVFRTPLRTLWKEVEKLLTTRRGQNAPLPRHRSRTVEALERHRFAALVWQAGGDSVAAARVTGRHEKLTYAYEYGGSRLPVALEGDDDPEGALVGSEREFSTGQIRAIVSSLRDELDANPSSFNALARYTAFITAFSLGHRGTLQSLPATAAIDCETQFCVVQDKSGDDDPTEARIVWVPDDILLQIKQYQFTVRRLAESTRTPIFEKLSERIENGKLCFPSPLAPDEIGGLHEYLRHAIDHAVPNSPLRPNVGRHWLRSELIGKCSSETVNAFFGHWNAGGDPWAHGSCLDPLAFREDLKRAIPSLLGALGIRPAAIAPAVLNNRFIDYPSKSGMPERPAGDAPPGATFHSCFAPVKIGARYRPTVGKIRARIVRTRAGMELGQLLASAIFNGALLDRTTWDAWLKASPTLSFSGEVQWVTMLTDPSGSGKPAKIFRWCADEWTRRLLQINRAKSALCETDRPAVEHLEEFLRSVFDEEVTSGEFLSWARAFWAFRLPTLLFDQATGELPCTALDSWAWSRMLQGDERTRFGPKRIYDPSYGSRDAQLQIVRQFEANATFARENEIFDLVSRLQRIGECDAPKARRLCLELLDDRLNGAPDSNDLSEAHKTLLRWCICLLGGALGQESYHRNSPYTVRLKLALIVTKIFRPWQFSRHFRFSLQDLVKAVGALPANDESLGLAWPASRSLGSYLKNPAPPRRRPVSAVDEDSYVGPETSPWVTAQVMDESAYQEFLRQLDAVAASSISLSGRELRLIATLGYRAGLRLKEIMGLRAKDFVHSKTSFELHVEHTRQRKLKTFTSRRLLPLHVLLSHEEIEDLQSWIRHRSELQQAIIETDGIFQQRRHRSEPNATHQVRAKDVNATDKIFGQVFSRAMIDLTAVDNAFKAAFRRTEHFKKGDFRWLRHSFSNFLMLNLMLPEKGAIDRLPPTLGCSVSWDRRNLLRAEFLGDQRLGQSVLHAVSQAMGHTGIGRTLATYQHLLDLILWLYVCRDPLTTPNATSDEEWFDYNGRNLTPACWTPDSSSTTARGAYRLPTVKPLHSEAWPLWLRKRAEKSDRQADQTAASEGEKPAHINELMLPWPLLVLAVNKHPDLGNLLAPYGALPEDTERWFSHGSRLAPTFIKKDGGDRRITVPHGAAAQFELNRLWQNRPSVLTGREADALATFIGSFSVKNGYARMRDMDQANLLIDFLDKQCGIERTLLQVTQTPAYNKVRKKKTGQAGADAGLSDGSFMGYPCLAFQLAKHEVGALGPTSDRSRRRTRPEEFLVGRIDDREPLPGAGELADAGSCNGVDSNATCAGVNDEPAFQRVRVPSYMVSRAEGWMPRHGDYLNIGSAARRGYDVPTNTSLAYAYKFFLFLLAIEHGVEPHRLPHLESKFHAKNTKAARPEVITAIYRARRGGKKDAPDEIS